MSLVILIKFDNKSVKKRNICRLLSIEMGWSEVYKINLIGELNRLNVICVFHL
ncbi:hypothetical protein THOB06_150039 [Vibrio rotiferianus]|nr:hypothetical protein THOG10_150039 [Vibrio rotiferianus]CAH1566211.1 hypothetical protein THOB06_150039 [Vibrio rotiferianus]